MDGGTRPCFATDRPFVIGLTGNIACGKSTVVGMLAELGATTIDADVVYHELIRPRTPLWQSVIDRFGPGIVGPDQSINRRELGQIVFTDAAALLDLDQLTHPAVVAEIDRLLANHGHGVVVVDAVKLIESGMDTLCDQIWVVVCEQEQQIDRLMTRNGLAREEAMARVRAQPDQEARQRQADIVIDNSGTVAATRRQVYQAWRYQVPTPAAS